MTDSSLTCFVVFTPTKNSSLYTIFAFPVPVSSGASDIINSFFRYINTI